MASSGRSLFLQPSGRLRSGWRLAIFILLFFASVALVMLVLRAAGLAGPHGRLRNAGAFRQLPVIVILVTLNLLVSAAILRAAERRSLATLGLALRRSALPGALLGLFAGALPVAISVVIFSGIGVASIRPSASIAGMVAPLALAALAVTTLGSAFEELLWRGYPFQMLIEGAGRWVAVLVTAALWAMGHANNPGANPASVFYLLLSGILLAWVVIRTGSLWFAIGYHIAWNVTAAHLFGLTTSGFDLGASFLHTTLAGPAWLTGGGFGFEGSFITETLDVLSLSTALLLARRVPPIAEAVPYLARRVLSEPPPAPEVRMGPGGPPVSDEVFSAPPPHGGGA